jgi:hypothetical protein
MVIMKKSLLLSILLISGLALAAVAGCNSGASNPRALLDTYFSSAVKQDYAAVYACYYDAYKAKIDKDEYIKHRREASVLQSYKIVSLAPEQDGIAHAEVMLTFAPSEKLKRKDPYSMFVKEDLVKEGGRWKVKVW